MLSSPACVSWFSIKVYISCPCLVGRLAERLRCFIFQGFIQLLPLKNGNKYAYAPFENVILVLHISNFDILVSMFNIYSFNKYKW